MIRKKLLLSMTALAMLALTFYSCNDDEGPTAKNPNTAEKAGIDRFSDEAGHLMKRSANPNLPAANAPVDFDSGEPFITKGLGPNGEFIEYYNFDVQSNDPAPIYAFFKAAGGNSIGLNVVNVIPGDGGYSDFWRVYKVIVPDNYVANTITSYQAIQNSGYSIEETDMIVNCPIVPDGSTATMRGGSESAELSRGWYDDKVIYYFNFFEKQLTVTADDKVPVSDIYVAFNDNTAGAASGFMTDSNGRTHNVTETLPSDPDYSPLWNVNPYDNDQFLEVGDLASAEGADLLAMGVALVNCPVVSVEETPTPKNPDTADKESIDRFSDTAGHLMKRSASPGLPAANAAIDFDSGEPFITKGLGPDGELVEYYNFDTQTTDPAPIYAFFKVGSTDPIGLNVIDVIPGDGGYNDFWRIYKVTVPNNYEANTLTSYEEIQNSGYAIEATDMIVNCPVVPEGSTATKRITGSSGLSRGWHDGKIVYYFNFGEKALMVNGEGKVSTSPIYVTFNINPDPDNPDSGPASGFMTDSDGRAHNVVSTLPDDTDYSPLWSVNPYDNADFSSVSDLSSAMAANVLAQGVAIVNCPIVSITQ